MPTRSRSVESSVPIFWRALTLLLAGGVALGASACSSGGGTAPTGAAGTSATGIAGIAPTGAGGTSASGAAGTSATGAAGVSATGAAGTSATGAAGTSAAAGTGGSGVGGTGSAGSSAGTGVTGAGGTGTDAGADAPVDKPPATDGGAMTLSTTSLKMLNGGLVFPPASSAPMNQSPALMWTNPPAGTLSFAISMYDATAKNTHWILWDIAPTETGLPASLPRGAKPTVPAGAMQMSAFGGTPGYEGPGGGSVNNYEIVLWALKVAKLNVGNMSLNTMHATLLPAQELGTAQILAKGTRNGL